MRILPAIRMRGVHRSLDAGIQQRPINMRKTTLLDNMHHCGVLVEVRLSRELHFRNRRLHSLYEGLHSRRGFRGEHDPAALQCGRRKALRLRPPKRVTSALSFAIGDSRNFESDGAIPGDVIDSAVGVRVLELNAHHLLNNLLRSGLVLTLLLY